MLFSRRGFKWNESSFPQMGRTDPPRLLFLPCEHASKKTSSARFSRSLMLLSCRQRADRDIVNVSYERDDDILINCTVRTACENRSDVVRSNGNQDAVYLGPSLSEKTTINKRRRASEF